MSGLRPDLKGRTSPGEFGTSRRWCPGKAGAGLWDRKNRDRAPTDIPRMMNRRPTPQSHPNNLEWKPKLSMIQARKVDTISLNHASYISSVFFGCGSQQWQKLSELISEPPTRASRFWRAASPK